MLQIWYCTNCHTAGVVFIPEGTANFFGAHSVQDDHRLLRPGSITQPCEMEDLRLEDPAFALVSGGIPDWVAEAVVSRINFELGLLRSAAAKLREGANIPSAL